MQNIEVRRMTREDIPAICRADNDETESFVNYLNRQLDFQENNECAALLALCDNRVAGYVFPTVRGSIMRSGFRRRTKSSEMMMN